MSADIDTIRYIPFQKESEIIVGRCSNEYNKLQSSLGQNARAQEIGNEWQKRFWEKPLKNMDKKMTLKIKRLSIDIRISKNGRLGKNFHFIGENFHNNVYRNIKI